MASKADLLPHILLPLQDLKSLPSPATKEDRLRTKISNLDKQHQAVRLSIVDAAKQKLDAHRVKPHAAEDSEDYSDQMNISPSFDSPHADEVDMSAFFIGLNEPFEEEKVNELHIGSRNPLPKADSSTAPAPTEIQLAKETLDQIALYDEHAERTRMTYLKEFERETKRQSSHALDPRTNSRSSSISYPIPVDPRNVTSHGVRGAAIPLDPRVTPSPIDGRLGQAGEFARPGLPANTAVRDPRLFPARSYSQSDPSRDPRLQRRN